MIHMFADVNRPTKRRGREIAYLNGRQVALHSIPILHVILLGLQAQVAPRQARRGPNILNMSAESSLHPRALELRVSLDFQGDSRKKCSL